MLDFTKFEILSFDCYGTLIDWEQGLLAALKPVFQSHGVDTDDEIILQQYAAFESAAEAGPYVPYRTILQRVLRRFGEEYGFMPAAEELTSFPDSIRNWLPFPDTVAALRILAWRYKLAIISNIDDDLFAFSARHLQIPFDWVITAAQVRAYKPSLKNFRHALRIMKTTPEKLLHVAQSLFHDHVPAKKLGLTTVWVNRRQGRPGTGATPSATVQPDLEVPDLQSLARLIG